MIAEPYDRSVGTDERGGLVRPVEREGRGARRVWTGDRRSGRRVDDDDGAVLDQEAIVGQEPELGIHRAAFDRALTDTGGNVEHRDASADRRCADGASVWRHRPTAVRTAVQVQRTFGEDLAGNRDDRVLVGVTVFVGDRDLVARSIGGESFRLTGHRGEHSGSCAGTGIERRDRSIGARHVHLATGDDHVVTQRARTAVRGDQRGDRLSGVRVPQGHRAVAGGDDEAAVGVGQCHAHVEVGR